MKKIKMCVISLICVLSSISLAFADQVSVKDKFTTVFDQEEYDQILDALKDTAPFYVDGEADKCSVYKVYQMTEYDMNKAVQSEESFLNAISTEYYWQAVTDNGTVIKVCNQDGKWEKAGQSWREEGEEKGELLRMDDIDAIATQLGKTDEISSVVVVRNDVLYADYVYITTNKDSYIVPFSTSVNKNGFTNGTIYELSEFAKYCPETIASGVDANGAKTYGGVDTSSKQSVVVANHSAMRTPVVCAIVLVGGIAIAAIAVLVTRKKKSLA